jgi:hypothetical protein
MPKDYRAKRILYKVSLQATTRKGKVQNSPFSTTSSLSKKRKNRLLLSFKISNLNQVKKNVSMLLQEA